MTLITLAELNVNIFNLALINKFGSLRDKC